MSKHTPGPWYASAALWACVTTKPDGYGEGIATVGRKPLGGTDEERANAALIAAAPDLLAACEAVDARLSKDCAGWYHDGDEESGTHDEDCHACAYEALHEWVRAAMLRARGGGNG